MSHHEHNDDEHEHERRRNRTRYHMCLPARSSALSVSGRKVLRAKSFAATGIILFLAGTRSADGAIKIKSRDGLN